MPARTEVINYGLELNPRIAINALKRFDKEHAKYFKKMGKSEKDTTTLMGKYIAKLGKAKPAFGPMLKAIDDLQKGMVDADQTIKNLKNRQLAASRDAADALAKEKELNDAVKKAKDEGLKKTLQAKLEEAKVEAGARKGALTAIKEEIDKERKAFEEKKDQREKLIAETKEAIEIDIVTLPDAAREAGQEIIKPFSAFMKKDFVGAITEAGALLRKTGKGIKGGMDPATMGGPLAKILDVLSKIGPWLGLIGSSIFAVIKLFLDAEQVTKDFNKSILETASTSGYLSRGLGDISAASDELEKDLKVIRDGAMDLSSIQWGISKDTAKALISSLTAEGVTLRHLREETERATIGIKDMADTIQMSVAYSRAFGVSLNELSQLQGEMMTEMGMGLDSVQTGFQMMTQGAEEAGMASNKFFGLVKSFSSDLSLFTLRMADLTKVMTVLGKTMSPRNAQKYLQAITGFLKGQGLMERTKMVMLGGKKDVGAILQEDVSRRIDALVSDLGDVGAGMKDMIATGNVDQVVEAMSKSGDKISSAQREAILDATIMQGKLNTGNMIEIASALKDASPIAVSKVLDKISQKRFGKPMSQLVGLQKMAFESMTGFNDEMLDQNRKAEAGLKQIQLDLVTKLEKYQQQSVGKSKEQLKELRKQLKITDVESNMMKKLGVTLEGEGAAQKVRDATGEEIWHSMDANEQDLIKGVEKQRNYQEEISSKQTSVIEKLGLLADIMMNYIYNKLSGIFDAIQSIIKNIPSMFGGTGGKVTKEMKEREFKVQAGTLGDKNVTKALKESEGNIYTARNKIVQTMGREMIADMKEVNKQRSELKAAYDKAEEGEEKTRLMEEMKRMDASTAALMKFNKDEQRMYEMKPKELLDYLKEMKEALVEAGLKGVGAKTDEETKKETKKEIKKEIKETSKKEKAKIPATGDIASKIPTVDKKRDQTTKKSGDAVGKTIATGTAKTVKSITGVKKVFEKPPTGYKKAVTDSTLDAIRTGLFEYYMYSQLDPEQMATGLKLGLKPSEIGEGLVKHAAKKGEGPKAGLTEMMRKAGTAERQQAGGLVTSITGGKANVSRLPPGEGWTPIGVGERIVPAGGRGGGSNVKVELALKGDLGRFISARVVEGTAQFERDKRLR
jgi:hypothetical protein